MVEFGDRFTHRHNPDGTFDSICMSCFQTVGHEKRESDLAAAEAVHKCILKLVDMGPLKKAPEPEEAPSPFRNQSSR